MPDGFKPPGVFFGPNWCQWTYSPTGLRVFDEAELFPPRSRMHALRELVHGGGAISAGPVAASLKRSHWLWFV